MPGPPNQQAALRRIRGLDLEQKVWPLYVAGKTQRAIAEELFVSQPSVHRAIKRAQERVIAELKTAGLQHKADQLVRLQHLYEQAVAAWEASRADRTKTYTKTKGSGTNAENEVGATRESSPGDPRFLEAARGALADIRKLLGLDAPTKVQQVEPERPFAQLSDEELNARLTAALEERRVH